MGFPLAELFGLLPGPLAFQGLAVLLLLRLLASEADKTEIRVAYAAHAGR